MRRVHPLNAPPSIEAIISGDTLPCTNTENLFSVEFDSTASYQWILPEGWQGNSDSSSIWITPEKGPGTITVIPWNSCGEADEIGLQVNPKSLPRYPVIYCERTSPCQNAVQSFYIIEEEEVDTWVLGAMAELSDNGKPPEGIIYESVLQLARQIRESLPN